MLRRVLVWELPVRLFHWATALSIFVLGLTGYYIGTPFISVPGDPAQAYLMGWVRAVHFIAAFVLGAALLIRLCWFFVGNRYAGWREWVPTSRERRAFLWRQLKYYLFLGRERPHHLGQPGSRVELSDYRAADPDPGPHRLRPVCRSAPGYDGPFIPFHVRRVQLAVRFHPERGEMYTSPVPDGLSSSRHLGRRKGLTGQKF